MSTDRDTTRIVRSWLRTDEHESAARVLDDVLDLLDATPQRRDSWPARRLAHMNTIAKLAIAAAAVVAVAAVAMLPASDDQRVGQPTQAAPSAVPSGDTAATPRPDPTYAPDFGDIEPGAYDIAWPRGPSDARIHLTVPAGWSWIGRDKATIYKDHGRLYGFPADLAAHAVPRVVTSVCALDESSGEVGPTFLPVGSTVADLTTAISNVAGTHWSGPTDVMLGDYPAKQLVTTYAADCPGPTRRSIWESDTDAFFLEDGVRSSIYVVDVDGDRLVIASHERSSSRDVVGELEAIIASIDIERGQVAGAPTPSPEPTPSGRFPAAVGPDADLRIGRHKAVVEDVPFSFSVPTRGWDPQLGFYISKSSIGSQGAEGTIRWTTVRGSRNTDACLKVLDPSVDRSAAEVADAVATAPGVDVVTGPQEVTVGGRAGMHVVLTVREDRGCDPGYFYAYEPVIGGALWTDTQPGDTIMVWIVDVDGTLLFIEGELHEEAGTKLVLEIQQIIDSIQFE
jgi:hypothetical protein